ncbi:UNVERIFIED_CONTAM: hypothetical protein GTU68_063230 [Idotea baltica]|nr:hypothetical protein [Idotea baltica]
MGNGYLTLSTWKRSLVGLAFS